MVDLCAISNDFFVFSGWTNTISAPGLVYSLNLGVIIDARAREKSIGHRPITGLPDWKGDKSCLHYNWKGNLILLPTDTFVSGTRKQGDYLYPTQSITKGTISHVFDVVTLYGRPGSAVYHGHQEYRGRNYPSTLYLDWTWNGDTLIVHHSLYSGINRNYHNVAEIRQYDTSNLPLIKDRRKSTSLLRQKTRFTFNEVYPTSTYYKVPNVITAFGNSPDPTELFERVERSLYAYGVNIGQCLPNTPKELWGDLTDIAVQNAQALDTNSIAYTRDLLKIRRDVDAILDILHGRVSMKKLADAWLSFKYGLRLTIKDSGELGHALGKALSAKHQKQLYSVCRAQDVCVSMCSKGPLNGVNLSDKYNLKIYYSPIDDKFLSLCKTLMDWDIMPTLQNVWDLIPYSFVIDWFLDFDRTLNRIDSNTYINTVRVLGTIKTRKTRIDSIPINRIGLLEGSRWSGTLSLDIYKRDLKTTLDLPLFRSGSPDEFHNIVELTAIIIQRMKRR